MRVLFLPLHVPAPGASCVGAGRGEWGGKEQWQHEPDLGRKWADDW